MKLNNETLREIASAALDFFIIGGFFFLLIVVVPWLYYAYTGNYLEF